MCFVCLPPPCPLPVRLHGHTIRVTPDGDTWIVEVYSERGGSILCWESGLLSATYALAVGRAAVDARVAA
ncbi:MAG: hypothetical protein Q8Q14_10920 [Gemmatimonadales bacterium]|nr:hypothetical protein [Gemmatimonadales bacterium]